MNWINNVVRPKIRSFLTTKREVPDNLWVKCPETGQMVFHKDLEANQFVVPGSGYHMRMYAPQRMAHLFDDGVYEEVPMPTAAVDPLKFRDARRYTERLKDSKAKSGMEDAVLVGEGKLAGRDVVAAAQDFRFMAGSLGMAAGEAIIAGMLRAVERNSPFILFAASGGARMQEGIMSLMQMPRTTIAVQRLRDAKLPYIVVLTDPTTGGVTASYAMLGDIHIAEPGALICFAGPRVIQQTIREELPDGFQRSEYLLDHGMIDMVVHRHEMRNTLSRICNLMMEGVERAEGKITGTARHRLPGHAPTPAKKMNGKANPASKAVVAKSDSKAATSKTDKGDSDSQAGAEKKAATSNEASSESAPSEEINTASTQPSRAKNDEDRA